MTVKNILWSRQEGLICKPWGQMQSYDIACLARIFFFWCVLSFVVRDTTAGKLNRGWKRQGSRGWGMKARRESSENIRCDPLNQNSDQSHQEKWSTSKSGPVFSKLFRLDWTDPLSLGLKFPEILVQWITPIINSLPSPSPPSPHHFLFQPRCSISTWKVRVNE